MTRNKSLPWIILSAVLAACLAAVVSAILILTAQRRNDSRQETDAPDTVIRESDAPDLELLSFEWLPDEAEETALNDGSGEPECENLALTEPDIRVIDVGNTYSSSYTLEAVVRNVQRDSFVDMVIELGYEGRTVVFNEGRGEYVCSSTTTYEDGIWVTKLRINLDMKYERLSSGRFTVIIREINFLNSQSDVLQAELEGTRQNACELINVCFTEDGFDGVYRLTQDGQILYQSQNMETREPYLTIGETVYPVTWDRICLEKLVYAYFTGSRAECLDRISFARMQLTTDWQQGIIRCTGETDAPEIYYGAPMEYAESIGCQYADWELEYDWYGQDTVTLSGGYVRGYRVPDYLYITSDGMDPIRIPVTSVGVSPGPEYWNVELDQAVIPVTIQSFYGTAITGDLWYEGTMEQWCGLRFTEVVVYGNVNIHCTDGIIEHFSQADLTHPQTGGDVQSC